MPQVLVRKSWGLKSITLTLDGSTIADAAAAVAREAGCSVVVSSEVKKPVSIDVTNVDAEVVLRGLAEEVGLAAIFDGGIVRFVERAQAGGLVAVVHPGYEDASEVAEMLAAVLGEGARVRRVGARVAVFGSEAHMERARAVFSAMDVGPDGWVLDVRVVQISDQLRSDLGLGWTLTSSIAATIGGRAGDAQTGPLTGLRALAAVEVIGKAVESGTGAKLVQVGTLALLEGSESELQQGDVVPVPHRTVSPEGVVSVSGYTNIQTGFNLKVKGWRVPGGGLRLTLRPSISSIKGFVEGSPILSERSVSGTVVVKDAEWVVLSGLDAASETLSASGLPESTTLLGASRSREVTSDSSVVLVRATRVFASVHVGEGVAGGPGGAAIEPPASAAKPQEVGP